MGEEGVLDVGWSVNVNAGRIARKLLVCKIFVDFQFLNVEATPRLVKSTVF